MIIFSWAKPKEKNSEISIQQKIYAITSQRSKISHEGIQRSMSYLWTKTSRVYVSSMNSYTERAVNKQTPIFFFKLKKTWKVYADLYETELGFWNPFTKGWERTGSVSRRIMTTLTKESCLHVPFYGQACSLVAGHEKGWMAHLNTFSHE